MLNQSNLGQFGYYEDITPSRTDPKTNHVVSIQDGKLYCTCPGWKFHGHCVHAYRKQIEGIKQKLHYYVLRGEVLSEAEFDSFDQVLERLSKNEEVNYLCNIIILLAKSEGKVNADMAYNTVQGKFTGDPRRLGVAFGILSRKKLIEWVGRHKSERKKRHAGKQEWWKLSEDGEAIFT